MRKTGLHFKVERSGVDENATAAVEPHELAKTISLAKAKAVARRHRNAIVIAADTLGVLDGEILGKPRSAQEAADMLAKLSGRAHSVITGFTVMDADDNKTVSQSVETTVHIRKLDQSEIDAYVRSEEPLDKAGAYAIQGRGAVLVERIEGDYSNVVGLPLCALAETLKDFGVRVL